MPEGAGGLRDQEDGEVNGGFLPPEPAGPEPDLESGPAATEARPGGQRHLGFAPPAEHEAHAPPPLAGAAPGHGLGTAGAPAGQAGRPQPWPYAPPSTLPGNDSAVAGLALSATSGGLLLLSVGLSSIISVICAALGIHYSRRGRDRVDRGETTKHRGLAQAGFVTGIVALALSIFFTVLWSLVAILYATDEGFRQDLEDELDDDGGDPPRGFETSLRVGVAAIRLLGSLIR